MHCPVCQDLLLSDLTFASCGHVLHMRCSFLLMEGGMGSCPICGAIIIQEQLKSLFLGVEGDDHDSGHEAVGTRNQLDDTVKAKKRFVELEKTCKMMREKTRVLEQSVPKLSVDVAALRSTTSSQFYRAKELGTALESMEGEMEARLSRKREELELVRAELSRTKGELAQYVDSFDDIHPPADSRSLQIEIKFILKVLGNLIHSLSSKEKSIHRLQSELQSFS